MDVRKQRRFAKFALFLGLSFCGLAALLSLVNLVFLYRADETPGTIVALREESDFFGKVYYPEFTYVDRSGVKHRKTAWAGNHSPTHRVGQSVSVLYSPSDSNEAVIDAFSQVWIFEVGLGASGTVLALLSGMQLWLKKP